jgi:hypothetical protein
VLVLTNEDRLIWRELQARASASSRATASQACVHYGELGMLVDPDGTWSYPMSRPPFRGFNDAVGHASQYEFEHGRPLLSSLVVTVDSGRPGTGFSQFAARLGVEVGDPDAFWEQELTRTVAFWSAGAVVLAIDARLDALQARMGLLEASPNNRTVT